MHAEKMTSREKHAVMSLSMIMILRMVGLFMVLPVFALYAEQLPGATATLVGLALGIYGLTQALCQIPFGAISDHYGRKPIILAGLLLFSLGSLIAALAHSIIPLIIGRALQGIGAIGSTLLAMIADFTREEQRTKSMAFAGMSIGLSFALAMLIGPLLMKWLSVGELFYLAVIFSLIAIFILYVCVPEAPQATWHRDTEPELKSFINILKEPELIKLNSGIFILHALFTANFIVIPISLQTYNGFAADQQWLIYLPTLIIAFLGSFLCMGIAEKKRQLKRYFIASIVVLGMAELLLWTMPSNLPLTLLGLGLFFGGFSLLEAFLPSLISRTAPAARKGTALGIYSSAQFLGIFVGGLCGGWLYGHWSFAGVYLFCLLLAFVWLIFAVLMQPPRYLVVQRLSLHSQQKTQWAAIVAKLQALPGVADVGLVTEEGVAYLKVESKTLLDPDFIHLKEQLH